MNREELIAKSYAWLSYLFQDGRIKDKVRRIYLFGSVARNDFDETSDIDLFIDVEKKNEAGVQKSVQRSRARFLNIEGEKWRLKGRGQELVVKVGFPDEWELKSALEREGILLYSSTAESKFQKYVLFSLAPISSPAKRIKIIRALWGRKEQGYIIPGLVQRCGGRIISSRVFLVPSQALKEVSSFLAKEKVIFAFEEMWQ